MVAPKRAWSILVHWCPRSEHATLRMITVGALLFSAFHLHQRANQLEQREQSLQRRIAAFSRETRERDERARTLLALPAPLEQVVEGAPAPFFHPAAPFVDRVVRRVDNLQTTDR